MKVTVEYAAQIKRAAGVSRDELEFESDVTLAGVFSRIFELRGESLQGTLFTEDGCVHSSILVFVGDTQVRDAENHPVPDGSVITFLSPISGG
ncbi:MAG: hypothetical protein Tsb009_10190 [Planctomycetaceae bacterium]